MRSLIDNGMGDNRNDSEDSRYLTTRTIKNPSTTIILLTG